MYSFPNLEQVHVHICFELLLLDLHTDFLNAGQEVWYSHLFQNFPQFVVIQTVKGFSIVKEAEVDIFFWNSLAFSMTQLMLAI